MLNKSDQERVDKIRREISPVIAGWVEVRLKAGMSWQQISDRLGEIKAVVTLAALEEATTNRTIPHPQGD